MAAPAKIYGNLLKSVFSGEINLATHPLKAALFADTYNPDQDAHRYLSQVSGEATGPGYTAGGKTVANLVWNYDAPTNTLTIDCDDPSWANSTITARYAIFYVDNGTGNKPLVCYGDLGTNVSSTNSTFTLQVDPAGLAKVTVS